MKICLNTKPITGVQINGRTYVDTETAMLMLLATDSAALRQWRKEGLPYIRAITAKKRAQYFYNIEDCNRWFSGEEFSDVGQLYGKEELCG